MNLTYTTKNSEILLNIPAAKSFGYRFKKRKNRIEFGKAFATRTDLFDDDSYLEWQIGYDIPMKDVQSGEKKTILKRTFTSNKGKKKYPYELPEIFYIAMQRNLITKKDVIGLLEEITKYKSFIEKKDISVEHHTKLRLNGINFEETSIKLPTFFMVETPDNTQIEVSIQKQQYATGIQPMVYFCIPVPSFKNSASILGKSSKPGDELIYVIGKNNVVNFINLMRVFGMASKRHNHDITAIIQTLL